MRVLLAGVTAFVVGAFTWVTLWVAPPMAAGALLHRSSRRVDRPRPASCSDATFEGAGVTLRGWRCKATAETRGTIVYLHGIADNRSGATAVVERFGPRGFDVVAYDGRAHGESDGRWCTYGVLEREDLRRVIATIPPGPVVLIGGSLGGAVAIQTAAIEPRVSAVVAVESFSDLRTVATERGRQLWLPPWTISAALREAERRGGFRIDDASPMRLAARVTVPVLLLHGAADRETPSAHSARLAHALGRRATLELIPEAGHNDTLRTPGVWERIEAWIGALGTRHSALGSRQ